MGYFEYFGKFSCRDFSLVCSQSPVAIHDALLSFSDIHYQLIFCLFLRQRRLAFP